MRCPFARILAVVSGLVGVGGVAGLAASAATSRSPAEPHWAFQPVSHSAPPPVAQTEWVRGTLDRWILAALEREGFAPAPEADRTTWLRRVTFDLTGLPPGPDEVRAFLADRSVNAPERVVDRLLASPRYGERWAQHWLDVVRFADTHGFEVNTERPNAWPYRDYVIRSFNGDLPYDQFVRDQIAGDQRGEDAATGFLVTASVLLPGQIGADDVSKRQARQDALDEIVVNVSQSFLGLTVGCARCHDHKFDPISQRDYYAMQAFVAGVEYGDRDLQTPEADALRREEGELRAQLARIEAELTRWVPRANQGHVRPGLNARLNVDRFEPVRARRVRFTILGTNALEPCLDELEVYGPAGTNVALASVGTRVSSSGDNVSPQRHELRFLHDGRYGNASSWMSSEVGRGWVMLEFSGEPLIDRVVWGRDREGQYADRLATNYVVEIAADDGAWRKVADATDRAPARPEAGADTALTSEGLSAEERVIASRLHVERRECRARIDEATRGQQAFAGVFRAPDLIRVLRRGDPEQPGDVVVPAVPVALGVRSLRAETAEAERRSALADWITSPEHPLTARVMVNRIWQGHFGLGLVDTPNDFGRGSPEPRHLGLLDWLAGEFIRGGWSMKHLHRLIVLSATYRQSSRLDPRAMARDAEARLLWRFPSRRLEAEGIRDSLLAASGRLNLAMYGRGFDLFDKRGGLTGFQPVEVPSVEERRRFVYAHKVRREREAVFGAFDCPDGGQSAARRRESTTPLQALNLLNSRFTLEEARALAERVLAEVGEEPPEQVRRAYVLTLGRGPSAEELADAEPVVREHGLTALARALFNSNEFLFLP